MILEFSNEKKFHTLLVLVIALSQITEVGGWEWFNYWSYRLLRWMPWYDQLPWAISYAQSLAYEAAHSLKKILPPVRPEVEELWVVVSVTQPAARDPDGELTTTPYGEEETSPRARRRLFGPFPLDPDQQLDLEGTFTF